MNIIGIQRGLKFVEALTQGLDIFVACPLGCEPCQGWLNNTAGFIQVRGLDLGKARYVDARPAACRCKAIGDKPAKGFPHRCLAGAQLGSKLVLMQPRPRWDVAHPDASADGFVCCVGEFPVCPDRLEAHGVSCIHLPADCYERICCLRIYIHIFISLTGRGVNSLEMNFAGATKVLQAHRPARALVENLCSARRMEAESHRVNLETP